MIDTIHNDLSALTDSGDEAEHIPTRPVTAPVKSQKKRLYKQFANATNYKSGP